MKLLDVITAAGARTSGGDPYQWNCFGDNAQYLEFRDINGKGYCHCIFDTKDYTVYQVHVDIPEQDRAFQWTNPEYITAFVDESKKLGHNPNEAWDDVMYNNIGDENTMLQYIEDIGNGDYDDIEDINEPLIMDMPGTIGGAKFIFPEEHKMEHFMVKLDVRYELEVNAKNISEALEKAKYFQETMPKGWGKGEDVSWLDTVLVKETVERNIDV